MNTADRLDLNEVISYYGQPTKQDNLHAYFQCDGGCTDSKKDNVTYTFKNNLLTSWCCDSAKKAYGEIIKRRNKNNTEYRPKIVKQFQEPQIKKLEQEYIEECYSYEHECNKALRKNKKALDFIYKKRGITEETALYFDLGIDLTKSYWTLPVYDFNSIVGFEFRKSDFSDFNNGKCRKKTGTPSCLAQITGKTDKSEILIILEGFIDAYVFWQHLKEKDQNEFYHILTPSCGVATVIDLLKKFDFSPYKKVVLYLDSDEKGIKAMKQAKELFPFIETVVMTCGCKDFNDHYLRCLKNEQSSKTA